MVFLCFDPAHACMRGVYETRRGIMSGNPACVSDCVLTRSSRSPGGSFRMQALCSTVIEPGESTVVPRTDDLCSLREGGVTRDLQCVDRLVVGSFRDCRVVDDFSAGIGERRVVLAGIVSLTSRRVGGSDGTGLIAWIPVASRHREGGSDDYHPAVPHGTSPQ